MQSTYRQQDEFTELFSSELFKVLLLLCLWDWLAG